MSESIAIDHLGPNELVEVPVPRYGGLVVVTGGNDIGKSEALRAVAKLVTGEGRLTTTRGFPGVGTVRGLGMAVAAGARTVRQGELAVDDLTTTTDLGVLIAPERQDPEKRDAVRIRALVVAVGLQPDLARFDRLLELLGEELEIPDAVREADDFVVMAARLKRRLEEEARAAAGEADAAATEAKGLRAAIPDDIDLDAPHDRAQLLHRHEATLRALEQARARRRHHDEVGARVHAAAAELERLAPPTEDALRQIEDAMNAACVQESEARLAHEAALDDMRASVRRRDLALEEIDADFQRALAELEAQRESRRRGAHRTAEQKRDAAEATARVLAAARARRDDAATDVTRATSAIEKARELQQTLALAQDIASAPTLDEIDALEESLARDAADVETGVRIRDARAMLGRAESLEGVAIAHQARADRYRRAAKGSDQVLEEILRDAGIDGLSIVDGRLLTRRGDEVVPFDERSPGAQARLAFDWLVPLAKRRAGDDRPGILVLEQRVYQELDYGNRREIASWADGSGVVIYTALATEGPLRVVLVSPDSEEGIR